VGARLIKETRGLLPAWLGTLLLVVVPLALLRLLPFPRPNPGVLAHGLWVLHTLGLALGPLVLSSTTFGREFDDVTFGLLLSQPVSRWRLWWEKTGLLALALATLGGAALALLVWQDLGTNLLPTIAGIILAAYGGGLLGSLLVRQTLGAVCLGAVVPFFLFVTLTLVVETRQAPGSGAPPGPSAMLWFWGAAAWATASYAGALLLFLRREDRASSAGLGVLGLRLRAPRRPGGRVRPWRALLWKELHLQQWGLYLGLALPVLTLIAVPLAPSQAERASIAFKVAVVAIGLLTLGVPALIGTATVADERRSGTLAWQRTLPVPHWKQFGVKLAVAWGLGLLCAPWAPLVTGEGSFVAFVPAVSAIVLAAVFASSLSRHVVQAMALSLALFLALLVATDGGSRLWPLVDSARWPPLLAVLLATAGVLIVLAGWNAREVTVSRRRLWANVATVAVAVALARVIR
jgi:hypothetical protein